MNPVFSAILHPFSKPIHSTIPQSVAAFVAAAEPDAFLFISFGESNSGGYALNSDAQAWEVGSRAELQFWNVSTDVFENMDIGTNNNLDHAGLASTTHGWELGLANRIRQGYFGAKDCYYVQTGQGGSIIANWNVGGAYWTEFLARVAAAKAALSSVNYQPVVWMTLGINDALAGTPLSNAAYKAGIEELIVRLKAELPNCKIYISTLPPVNGTYTGYSTQIIDIGTADADVVAIDVTDPVELDYRDANHWSHAGMKRLASRFVAAMQADFDYLTNRTLTWNVRNDSGFLYHVGPNQHANASENIDVTVDGYIAMSLVGGTTTNQGVVIALDSDVSEVNWGGGSDSYYGGCYQYIGDVYWTATNGAADLASATSPCWARLRWVAANDDILLETSTDGGATWTLRHTFSGVLAAVSSVRVKSLTAVEAGFIDVWTG